MSDISKKSLTPSPFGEKLFGTVIGQETPISIVSVTLQEENEKVYIPYAGKFPKALEKSMIMAETFSTFSQIYYSER